MTAQGLCCCYYLFGQKIEEILFFEECILWDINPYSPLKLNGGFGGTCRLRRHGLRINQAKKLA
jgi:hypothetical protein